MPINGMIILDSPTPSFTGGTGVTYEDDGTPVATGIHISDTTETDQRLKKHITFKNKNGALQNNGTFSKFVRKAVGTIPFVLADGTISYQVVRIELEAHPEYASDPSRLANLRCFGGQLILDGDTDKFYQHGSTR